MAEMGKFVWKDVSTKLSYSVQGEYCHIENLNEEGFRFLDGLDPGNTIALHKSNGETLNMEVINLVHHGISRVVECRARILRQ